MNGNKSGAETINILQNHRSVRQFKKDRIPSDILESMLLSAQSAPSSSHGQAYSIINVTDIDKKKAMAEYAGNQQQVIDCSNFFVFCGDLHRLDNIASLERIEIKEVLDSTEMYLIATVDATLAAQNLAIAAEALGFGIVYTGGIRNNPQKVSNLLELPSRVYPVFGMCVGYPQPHQIPEKKPRLPLSVVCHENKYASFEEIYPSIQQYDEIMKEYYLRRTRGSRADSWSHMMTDKRKVPRRMHMKKFLEERGFPLL